MALRQATQGFLGLARTLAPCQASSLHAIRCMSLDGLKGFKDTEAALEDMFATKEDQRLLSKLMLKMKAQADIADKHAAVGEMAAERSALRQITEKYKMSKEDAEKLIKWKHTAYLDPLVRVSKR